MHDEDTSNPYLTNQVRRSGSPRPKNARARLEQEEIREAIKASAQAAKQSNTPSRETKLDQVRASRKTCTKHKLTNFKATNMLPLIATDISTNS